MIHNWQTYFGERTLDEHAAANPNGMLDRSLPEGLAKKPQAVARVSGSFWIVDCPAGDGGAELANFDDLRFFCCNCRNTAWQGQTLPVKVPPPAQRLQVEQALSKRPDPATRNWSPGESIADLKVENLEHAVAP